MRRCRHARVRALGPSRKLSGQSPGCRTARRRAPSKEAAMVRERHLTKEDISAILKRAAQLQAADTGEERRSSSGGDLTLHELQQSAAEVGIAPRFIEAAASELQP